MQRSGDWEHLQASNDEIPSHEFMETADRDMSTGDIQAHSFLESSEFVDVTGDGDVSMEIKAHPLLTESGEHMLVTPTYSPRSGSSVDPADMIPVNLVNSSVPTPPLTHDGSGDKVMMKEKETGSEPKVEKVVEDKSKTEITSRDDRGDEVVKAEGERGEGGSEDKEVGKVEPPVIEVTEVIDSKETSLEAAALETGTVETAEELTAEKTEDNKVEGEGVKTDEGPGSDGASAGPGSDGSGTYISYVHHMTANKKLIKAKDLFYQLGFQKGVSRAEIENAAIQQYKLAASKQAKFWVKDARYFAEILFSGTWIDQNLSPLDGRSGRQNRGNKKKKQKNYNINEQFELPGGTCRDFRLKDNPDLQTVRENAASTESHLKTDETEKSEESLDKFVSDYTSSVIDQAIKIAISDGLSESAIMEVIEDVTGSNLANTPKKGNGNVCDTPKKGKLTPLDLSRTPRQRPDQLAIGFNYHADVVVKESPKTVHGEIIPIDLSRPPRERPEQIAVGFSYHSDMIVKESPRDPSGEILTESSPATPRRRARDQLAMGFSYHSKLLAKDVVVDHNENLTKAENENQDSRKEETRNNVTPEKATDVERIVPKSGKKSISDTFAVGFSYNSDLIVKESMDQANGNVDAQDTEEESKIVEKNNEEVMENGDLNGNIAELADMAGELKLAGSVW